MNASGKPPKGTKRRSAELSDEFKKAHPFCFVEIRLTESDRLEIDNAIMDMSECAQWMQRMPFSFGYKIGVSYHTKQGCFVVSVTSQFYGSDDFNRCVVSRHPDFQVAVTTAHYKHDTYCREGIPPSIGSGGGGPIWD